MCLVRHYILNFSKFNLEYIWNFNCKCFRIDEGLRQPIKLQALTLLGHVVRRQPSWIYKITQHPLLKNLLKLLKVKYKINREYVIEQTFFFYLSFEGLIKVSLVFTINWDFKLWKNWLSLQFPIKDWKIEYNCLKKSILQFFPRFQTSSHFFVLGVVNDLLSTYVADSKEPS